MKISDDHGGVCAYPQPAAKIRLSPREFIDSTARVGVKMRSILMRRDINSDNDPLGVSGALKHKLRICKVQLLIIAVGQTSVFTVYFYEP